MLALLVACALLMLPGTTSALQVAIALSQQGGAPGLFATALAASPAAGMHRLDVAGNVEDGFDQARLDRADLVIAVGAPAAEALAARSRRPVLAVLLSRQQFLRLQQPAPGAALSAIVLDQPPVRQIRLVRAVMPDAGRLGMLFGPDSRALALQLAAEARTAGLEPAVQEIAGSDELLPALDQVLTAGDALLALPDPLTSGPSSARAVLLTSYRYRRPIFAYSRAFVEAGALAAVYSTPEDIAREVAQWLQSLGQAPLRLPPVRGPANFGIAVNRQVARALNLDVPPDEVLKRLVGGDGPP